MPKPGVVIIHRIAEYIEAISEHKREYAVLLGVMTASAYAYAPDSMVATLLGGASAYLAGAGIHHSDKECKAQKRVKVNNGEAR